MEDILHENNTSIIEPINFDYLHEINNSSDLTTPNLNLLNSVSNFDVISDSNLNQNCKNQYVYFNSLKNFSSKCNFSILHLNINSIYNKIDEIDNILSLNYEIVMLNETKLDSSIPNAFYKNVNYNIIRLDRTRNGGGIIVFIRREYTYTSNMYTNIEAITFKVTLKKNTCTFISTYKPPSKNDKDYLDDLELLLCDIDQNQPIFIIGDLNMDLKSKKGCNLMDFMDNNQLTNFVDKYTRTDTRFIKKKNKYVTSKSLIDVILHNKNQIIRTQTIGCPFSDHHFVLADLSFPQAKRTKKLFISRNLCLKNLNNIDSQINIMNIAFLYNGDSVESKLDVLKNSINTIIFHHKNFCHQHIKQNFLGQTKSSTY